MQTKWFILGRIGKEPELRYTSEGKAVITLSVVANVGYGDNKKPVWYRCSAFEKSAETIHQYTHKGDRIYLECVPSPGENGSPRLWESNGRAGASYECVIRDFEFLGEKKSQQEEVF